MICVVRNSDGHVAFEADKHSHTHTFTDNRENLFRVCILFACSLSADSAAAVTPHVEVVFDLTIAVGSRRFVASKSDLPPCESAFYLEPALCRLKVLL